MVRALNSTNRTTFITLLSYCVAVRYQLSEDPKLLKSTEVPELSKAPSTRISLSPDARVVAVSVDQEEASSIYIYPTASDAERISIIDIHRGIYIVSNFSLSLSLSPPLPLSLPPSY